MLDMWDRVGVKVTSQMVGKAVGKHPELAKEIVDRGHEAAGHGQTWEPQYSMTPEQERAGYQASIDTIQKATGSSSDWLQRILAAWHTEHPGYSSGPGLHLPHR